MAELADEGPDPKPELYPSFSVSASLSLSVSEAMSNDAVPSLLRLLIVVE